MTFRVSIYLTVCLCMVFPNRAGSAEINEFKMPTRIVVGLSLDSGSTMMSLLEAEPSLELTLSPAVQLVLSSRLRLDGNDELEPGEPAYDNYTRASRPLVIGSSGTVELRDAYLQVRLGSGVMRFGKQQIVWGRLDGVKILDVLQPQDFRQFILDDLDQSRISLWSAYVDISIGSWRAEFAFIPDATGHAIPESGAWFELTAPRFRFGASSGQSLPSVQTERTEIAFERAAGGVRLSRQFGPFDVSGVAYTGIDFEPLGRLVSVDQQTIVQRYYQRREVFGLSAETAFGSVALRAEYAFQPDRSFNLREENMLSVTELDQHRGAIAMDIDAPFGVFLNIQYLLDSVQRAPADLVRPSLDRLVTMFLRRSFRNDMIAIELRWYHSLVQLDDLSSFSVKYDLTENTQVRIGAEFFGGAGDGTFGQFSNQDRLIFGVEHTF